MTNVEELKLYCIKLASERMALTFASENLIRAAQKYIEQPFSKTCGEELRVRVREAQAVLAVIK